MNVLLQKYPILFNFKNNIENYFIYQHHQGELPITHSTLSIVMTACNRSKQTLFTLKTISNSTYKDIQVILVDDSDVDPIEFEMLKQFPMNIEFIKIKKDLKWWANPCVNYNIGFSFIKGGYVIIQNAEVCHVGDVISVLINTISDNFYYVFDVCSTKGYEENEILYTYPSLTTNIYKDISGIFSDTWFHRTKERESYFHFLTGMTKSTFDLFNGFSYDYSFGTYFDDNDLLLRIKCANIKIKSICFIEHQCGGIHLFHQLADNTHTKGHESNYYIFSKKKQMCEKYNQYLEVTYSQKEFHSRLSFFLNS